MEFYSELCELAEVLGKHAINLGTVDTKNDLIQILASWLWLLNSHFDIQTGHLNLESQKRLSIKHLLLNWKLNVQIENVHFYSSCVLSYKSKNYPSAVSMFSN